MTIWWKQSGGDLSRAVVDLGSSQLKRTAGMRARDLAAAIRYEVVGLTDLTPIGYTQAAAATIGTSDLRWAIGRMIVAAAVAKIAGTQQPKTWAVTTEADWSAKQRAKKIDQFIEGLWSTRQEPYADIWELGLFAWMRDAALFGSGHVKTSVDEDEGAVIHERVLPWEWLSDPYDAQYGAPRTRVHVFGADREHMLAVYPEHKQSIMAAASIATQDRGIVGIGYEGADRILIYDAYRIADGPGLPGKHCMAVAGGYEPLLEEDWEQNTFPVVSMYWDRAIQGVDGISLMAETEGLESFINEILARVADTMRRTAMNIAFVDSGDSDCKEQLEKQADAVIIEKMRGTNPQFVAAAPFNPGVINFIELVFGKAFELTGMNQMTATAQKQPGIVANAAIETMADLQSERFSPQWRAYQNCFVEQARQDIQAVKRLAEANPDFAVRWAGSGFLRSIKVADWNTLDDDMYRLALQPAPTSKGTAAGRMQSATDMFQAGSLSADSLAQVKLFFDANHEIANLSKQRAFIDRMLGRWLEANDQQIADNTWSGNVKLIQADAIKHLRLEDAIVQVHDAYLDALMDDAPDGVLGLFNDWVSLADQELQNQRKAQAELQAAAQQPPAPAQQPMPPM